MIPMSSMSHPAPTTSDQPAGEQPGGGLSRDAMALDTNASTNLAQPQNNPLPDTANLSSDVSNPSLYVVSTTKIIKTLQPQGLVHLEKLMGALGVREVCGPVNESGYEADGERTTEDDREYDRLRRQEKLRERRRRRQRRYQHRQLQRLRPRSLSTTSFLRPVVAAVPTKRRSASV